MDLSIIIPTLNEGNYIGKTLRHLFRNLSNDLDVELILVDGGSIDNTMKIIKKHDVSLYEMSDFLGKKYLSLNFGAVKAKGKYLMFLDADCLVPKHFDTLIAEVLEDKKNVGGAFEFKMEGKGLLYRTIEFINRIRYRIKKRYYGDQGIFCRKSTFETCGGFPENPIMEAAYFCDNISKIGKLTLIKMKIVSSVRRFEQGNVLKVMTKDTLIWIQFLLGLNISKYAPQYWKENVQRGQKSISNKEV